MLRRKANLRSAVSFQTAVTVEQMLTSIHKHEYLMPAIQREFVWGTDQMIRLVDSLMRGYPIGSFLLWDVAPETAADYTFYDFLTHFHERDSPFASMATVPSGQGTVAILDGQQRLTSLNIAVYGSHAEKRKYYHWHSAGAFQKKRMHLNLAENPTDEELGIRYDLRFLTDEEAKSDVGQPDKWFRVGAALDLEDAGPKMLKEITGRNLVDIDGAYQRLYDLHQALRVAQPMNYYLVTDQDANKVLEIFVRVNSGGTTLSYSDLLLSMATNQWKELDAREEVRSLVQELNQGASRQFAFSKDLVLKAALMMAGVDLRFRVSNFTKANMAKVEEAWPEVEKTLVRAANLIHQFGFSERTLTADSVIIPVAYYLHKRKVSDGYLDSSSDAVDRDVLRKWVTRSLIKRGIWGSGLDTTLARIRDALDASDSSTFPVDAVEAAMAAVGKSLVFDDSEIDELLALKYAGQRTFAVLSVIYPGLDLSKTFHEDHVFPKSRFTTKRLLSAGIPADQVGDYQEAYNLLPNLQLLAGTANIQKQAELPGTWIDKAFATDALRDTYIAENDLSGLDLGFNDFLGFIAARKAKMRSRLIAALSS